MRNTKREDDIDEDNDIEVIDMFLSLFGSWCQRRRIIFKNVCGHIFH
jgi:hypothetical protein